VTDPSPIPASLDFADHLRWWLALSGEQRATWRANYGRPVVARQWAAVPTDTDGLPIHPPAPWSGDLDMAYSPAELDAGHPEH